MENKKLIYPDGKQVEIPSYSPDNKEELIVDINAPLSIASILVYQIDNWDLEEIGEDAFSYGTLDAEGNFQSFSYTEDGWQSEFFLNMDCSYDELVFAQSAVKYPELYPLLETYAKLLIEASEAESSSGPWATEETVLGQFLIFELANADKKYLYLAEDFSCNVEVRCSTNFGREYRYSMEKLYTKWNILDKMIPIVQSDIEIDCDAIFDLIKEDENSSEETINLIDELVDYWRSSLSINKENNTITVYSYEDDGLDQNYILKDFETFYGFKIDLDNKSTQIFIFNDSSIDIDYEEDIMLDLSDSFYEKVTDFIVEK